MSTAAPEISIPSNPTFVNQQHLKLHDGRSVTVYGVGAKCLFAVVGAIERVGIIAIPPSVDVRAFLDDDQKAELGDIDATIKTLMTQAEALKAEPDGAETNKEKLDQFRNAIIEQGREKRRKLTQWAKEAPVEVKVAIQVATRQRLQAFLHYALGVETLMYAIIGGVCDLGESAAIERMVENHELQIVDLLNIANAAIDLTPVPATVEAALSFFSRTSDLMGEYEKQGPKFRPREKR